jgi:type IV secretion system protein VirB9
MRGLWLALIATPVLAAQVPQPGAADPRIRTVLYSPREVVTVTGQIGYQIVIGFGPGERIENVALGDALAWTVTPNKKADLLFIKPVAPQPSTNMAVVTNLRRYNFELIATRAAKRRQQIYDIRFTYPPEPVVAVPVAAPPPPPEFNFAYSYAGSRANVPAKVFDDGHETYFEWAAGAEAPAVFVVGPDGKEALTNQAQRGKYMVVDRVAAAFVLRNGAAVTQVYNDALKPAPVAEGGPRARDEEPKKKRGLFARKAAR